MVKKDFALVQTADWTMNADIEASRERLLQTVYREGGVLRDQSKTGFTVTTGSQVKMRLIGGAFGSASWIPTKIVVHLDSSGDETEVKASVSENIGLGGSAGMRKKIQQRIAELLFALQQS
jgi:hypothetical protein|tara:strand:+ start:467 stop:829 length:363 start_codon:yes stop_codon:yes gene_type:complete